MLTPVVLTKALISIDNNMPIILHTHI